MNRDIKFRFWDNNNSCYHKPIYRAMEGELESILIGKDGRLAMWCLKGLCDESLFENRFQTEQFTGLKDCNGIDIYEGDIDAKMGKVFYYEGAFLVGNEISEAELLQTYYPHCNIVGNIHEHKHLL